MDFDEKLQLREYLARPRLISKFDLLTITPSSAPLKLFTLWKAKVANKLKGYKHITGCMKVDVFFTGYPSSTGTYQLSFYPEMHSDINSGLTALAPPAWFVSGAPVYFIRTQNQLPHITIPMESRCSESICLPYPINLTAHDIWSTNELWYATVNPVNAVILNDGTTPVDYILEIYVSMEDVKLFTAIQEEGPEVPQGVISRALDFMSNMTKAASGAFPYLSPWSKLLKAGSDVALSLGYSRPTEPVSQLVVARTTTSTGIAAGESDFSHKIGMSPFTASTIDYKSIPMGKEDDMLISGITSKWGMIMNDINANAIYYPIYPVYTGTSTKCPTPLSFISSCFQRYSGTIQVKFEFVANPLIRQRAVIYMVPTGSVNPSTYDPNSTLKSFLVDICGRTEIVIDVPYNLYTPFASVAIASYSLGVVYISQTHGRIPNIAYNVYIRGGPDFVLVNPCTHYIKDIAFEGHEDACIFGEHYTSLSELLRVPCAVGSIDLTGLTTGNVYVNIPLYGVTGAGFGTGGSVVDSGANPFGVGFKRTFLSYLAGAFLGMRGSVRHKIFNIQHTPASGGVAKYIVASVSGGISGMTTTIPRYDFHVLSNTDVLEIEIPNKASTNFSPAQLYARSVPYDLIRMNINLYFPSGSKDNEFPWLMSAGEDFILGGFLCAPPI